MKLLNAEKEEIEVYSNNRHEILSWKLCDLAWLADLSESLMYCVCSPLCSSTNLLLCRGFFLYYNNVRACMYGKNSCLVLTKQIAFLLFEADVKILITLIIGIWKRIRVSIVNIAFCTKLQRHFVNYKETYLFNFVWI